MSALRGGVAIFTAGRKRARVILLLAAILVLDQGAKLIVDRTIPLHRSIPVIEGLFDLTHARNTGAAFGLLAGERRALASFILIAFSLAAVGFIIHLLRRLAETDTGLILSLTFILAGALGNLIDRVVHGEVIDFLDVYWKGYHWPAFNVADSFITVGAALCLWCLMRIKGRDPFAPPSGR